MPAPLLPRETSEALGLPRHNQSVANGLLDDNSIATGTTGLKRKAYALDEPEVQPYPLRTHLSVHDGSDPSNIKKEPGIERATDSPGIANGITEHTDSSKSVSGLASTESGDVDDSYTHISGFTPVNGRASRRHESVKAGQLKHVNNKNPGVVQSAPRPSIESLTDNDKICLLGAVAEVEAKFEKEKWGLIAEAMKRAGAAEYSEALLKQSAETLQRIQTSIRAQNASSKISNIQQTSSDPRKPSSAKVIGINHKPNKTDGTDHGSNRGNYHGFGVLVNQLPLQNTAQVPPNIRHQMSRQSAYIPESAPPLGTAPHQQAFPEPTPLYPPISPSHPPSSQPNDEQPLPHPNHVQETSLQQASSRGKSPGETPAISDNRGLSTPSSEVVVAPLDSTVAKNSKQPISEDQLKDMLRHRNLNETNRSKPWDTIAKGGKVEPLNKISKTLEQAGSPTILYTHTGAPIFVAHPASSGVDSSHTGYVSLYDSKHPSSDPVRNKAPTSPATAVDLTKGTNNTISPSPPKVGQTLLASAKVRTPPGQMGPERRKKGQRNESAESRERRSAAMRKAWAKRQAEGRSGRGCGPPKSSTTARSAQSGNSPIAFAAQVLAAAAADAAAEATSPSKSKSRDTSAVSPTPAPVIPEEGPSSIAHKQNQDSSGHKRDPSKQRSEGIVQPLDTENRQASQRPSRGDTLRDEKPCPYACEKCGKSYTTPGGLNYHRASMPHCENGPQKPRPFICNKCGKSYQNRGGLMYHQPVCEVSTPEPDRKIDSAGTTPSTSTKKRTTGPRIVGGARINGLSFSPGAREAQLTAV